MKIIQYWDSTDLPDDIASLTETWKQHNADMNYLMFDKSTASDYLSDTFGGFVVDLFLSARIPAMQSDIFRVGYCLAEGAFYADAASRCIAPVSTLVPDQGRVLLMKRTNGPVCNGFIACSRNSEALFSIWQNILRNMFRKDIDKIWLASGPGAYQEIIKDRADLFVIREEAELRNSHFMLVGGLSHKGESHWRKRQANESIYSDTVSRAG